MQHVEEIMKKIICTEEKAIQNFTLEIKCDIH